MPSSTHPVWRPLIIALLPAIAAAQEAPAPGRAIRIFDGRAREILYRTSSHDGGRQLQELLRLIPGGDRFTVSKMPYRWPAEQMAKFPVQVRRMNNNFSPHFKIAGADDAAGIAAGVAVLRQAAEQDLALGLKAVFYHTGHYNENTTSAEAIRQMYDTRLAYLALQKQNADPRIAFIDCMTPTRRHFPATIRPDGFHASATANYLEGLEIVRAMCAHDGIPLPPAVETLVAAKVAEAAGKADAISVLFPDLAQGIDEPLMVGDTVTVRWKADAKAVPGVYVMLHAVFGDDFYLSEAIPAGDARFGTFTWTVSLDLLDSGNRPGQFPPDKAARRKLTSKDTAKGTVCFRIITSDLAQAGEVYAFSSRFRIDLSGASRAQPRHVTAPAGP